MQNSDSHDRFREAELAWISLDDKDCLNSVKSQQPELKSISSARK